MQVLVSLFLIIAAPSSEALCAELVNGPNGLKLSGEIEPGDADRIVEKLIDGGLLSLDSKGGAFSDGLRIAQRVREAHVKTIVEDGASCFSVCAIIFLSGSGLPEDEHVPPDRSVSPKGIVGLHAPFLEYDGQLVEREIVEVAYDVAVKNIADLIRFSKDIHLSEHLLPEFLEKGRREFLVLNTVDKLARYKVKLLGLKEPSKITPQMINNYCANYYAWSLRQPSIPFQQDENLNINELPSYINVGKASAQKLVFESRPIQGGVRYLMPSNQGPEGTPAVCVFDLTTLSDGTLLGRGCDFILFGGDKLNEAWGSVGKKEFVTECRNALFDGDAVAFAPPDTPIDQIEAVLSLYQKMDRPNHSHVTSKPGSFNPYKNFDLQGGDFQVLKEVASDVCSVACGSQSKCLAYSYDKWNRWCFLKDRLGELRFDPQSDTAVRVGVRQPERMTSEIRIARARNRVVSGAMLMKFANKSYEACETACRAERQCLSFSYSKLTNDCQMHSDASQIATRPGTDSGIKRQLAK